MAMLNNQRVPIYSQVFLFSTRCLEQPGGIAVEDGVRRQVDDCGWILFIGRKTMS